VNIQEQLALCWIIGDDDIPYVAVQNIGTAEKTPVYQYDWLYGYSEARGVIIDKSTAFFYVNDNRDEGNQDGSVYYLNIDNNATEKIFSVSSDQAVRQFYKDTILMNQDNGFAVFDLTLRHIIIEGKGNILGMYGDLYAVQNGKSITLYDIDRKAKYTYDATTYIDELSADNIYVNLPWVEEPVVNIGTYASDEVIRLVFDVHQ